MQSPQVVALVYPLVREDGVWKFKRRQVFAEAKQP
jgi:hypothetical protein